MEPERSPSLRPLPAALAGVHLEESRGAITSRPAAPHSTPWHPCSTSCSSRESPAAPANHHNPPVPPDRDVWVPAPAQEHPDAWAELSCRSTPRHDRKLPHGTPPTLSKSVQSNAICASPMPGKAVLKQPMSFFFWNSAHPASSIISHQFYPSYNSDSAAIAYTRDLGSLLKF